MNEVPLVMRSLQYQDALTRLMRACVHVPDKAAIDSIMSFRRLFGLPSPKDCDPEDYLIGLHRARLHHTGMTQAEKTWSAHWLIRQGYTTDLDGVFLARPEQKPKQHG